MSEIGKLVAGRYRVRRRLGGGTTGAVWKAVDERLKRPVAIKQLLPDTVQADRAVREGREAMRLRHPHVVSVHDVDHHDGSPLLIMEYFPSRSLAEVVAEDGPLPPMEAARVGAQLASALAEAHEAGIVHGDVSPGTVLVADDGTVKLGGFVSPADRGGRATPGADVHALGATLSEVLPGGTGAQAGPLAPLLDAMLAEDPARRSTAAEAAEDLLAVAEARSLTVAAKRPALVGAGDATVPLAGTPAFTRTLPTVAAERGSRARPTTRRRRWWPAALALLVAVLATVVLLVAIRSSEDGTAEATAPGTSRPGDPLTASQLRQAVAAFYAPLPGGTDQAWERLGPGLRAQGRDAFDAYWSGVTAVIVVSAPKVTAADSVHVGIELTLPDGSTVTEFHQFGVVDRHGTAVLDSDTVLHTATSAPAPPTPARPQPDTPAEDDDGDRGGTGDGGGRDTEEDPDPAGRREEPRKDDGPGRGRGDEHGNTRRGDG
ncbi:protein kinase domain-containing protein [Prauserella endophytica]|uniref:non-specific serine/threonine protein kinase n=1 Tax=Prauserella endophytica TaxID=1592324 RepID=A0ABY2S3A7_9PSEU|nr:serine/threonine-protein kinase [Prauserella endophytica]TKG69715.1 serine/threonine protein kinase [Prauserella endophytica]